MEDYNTEANLRAGVRWRVGVARTLLAAGLCATTMGCNVLDALTGESAKWREQIATTTKAVVTASDTLALAVPGERYLRLIDAATGGDETKKGEAREHIRRLFALDTAVEYEASVWFTVDQPPPSPIRADFFMGPSTSPRHVENHCRSRALNLTQVGTTTLAYATAELDAKIASALSRAFDQLSGSPTIAIPRCAEPPSGTPPFRFAAITWPDSALMPTSIMDAPCTYSGIDGGVVKQLSDVAARASSKRALIVSSLREAIKAPFETTPTPTGAEARLHRPWAVLSGDQFLFVVIPKKDWDTNKGHIRVMASVHQKGQAETTLKDERRYEFRPKEFEELNAPYDDPVEGQLLWAVHNMTGAQMFSEELLTQLQALNKVMEDWSKVSGEHPAK